MSVLHREPVAVPQLRQAEPVPAPRGGRERLFHPFAGDVPVVLVPGLRDGDPRHWLARWQQAHPAFLRVAPPAADPDLETWADAVAKTTRTATVPPLVVAHGFGCLAAVRAAFRFRLPLAGAMLVAPADPLRLGVAPSLPAGRLPYPSLLVASPDDPTLRLTSAGRLAQLWGARLEPLIGSGSVADDARLGSWPAGIALLRDLAERAAAAGSIVRSPRPAVRSPRRESTR